MNIESELPEEFDELEDEQKVRELKSLKKQLDSSSDAGAIKKRMIEELIRKYS